MEDVFPLPEHFASASSDRAFLSTSINGLVVTNSEGETRELPLPAFLGPSGADIEGHPFASFEPELFDDYGLKQALVNPNGKYLLLYGPNGAFCVKRESQGRSVDRFYGLFFAFESSFFPLRTNRSSSPQFVDLTSILTTQLGGDIDIVEMQWYETCPYTIYALVRADGGSTTFLCELDLFQDYFQVIPRRSMFHVSVIYF